MKAKIFLLLFSAIAILGCKNDQTDTTKGAAAAEAPDDTFKVIAKVIVKEDDNLSLFYTEDGSTDFKNEPLWSKVVGSAEPQEVIYTLPKDVFPTQLRLDFGVSPEQVDVTLQSVTFQYKDKSRTIAGAELGNFFRADDSKCTFDPATGIITAPLKDGKKLPSLYPHEGNLGPELQKLAL
jgi:hypothetical protein